LVILIEKVSPEKEILKSAYLMASPNLDSSSDFKGSYDSVNVLETASFILLGILPITSNI
jgi:hypothetical protein